MNNEENCHICDLYDVYNQLIVDGFEPKVAFKTVIEEAENAAYKDGLLSVLFNVHENITRQIDDILCDGNCEECTCGLRDAE